MGGPGPRSLSDGLLCRDTAATALIHLLDRSTSVHNRRSTLCLSWRGPVLSDIKGIGRQITSTSLDNIFSLAARVPVRCRKHLYCALEVASKIDQPAAAPSNQEAIS